MPARLAQLAIASLLAGTMGLRNNLKFVLIEDNKVTILPAALARRETNPAQ